MSYERFQLYVHVTEYPYILLDVGMSLINQGWLEDTKGKRFDYMWNTETIFNGTISDNKLTETIKVFDYLESTIPKEDPLKFILTYEAKGLLYYLKNEKEKSKFYFAKAVEVSPQHINNYKRSKTFLDKYLN